MIARRNARRLMGKKSDEEKEILGFSKWKFSQQIPASVPVGFAVNSHWIFQQFRIEKEEISRWLKFTFQTKYSGVFCHHSRSGVVFTPQVRMKHVDRRWKAYPAGNKGESPEF